MFENFSASCCSMTPKLVRKMFPLHFQNYNRADLIQDSPIFFKVIVIDYCANKNIWVGLSQGMLLPLTHRNNESMLKHLSKKAPRETDKFSTSILLFWKKLSTFFLLSNNTLKLCTSHWKQQQHITTKCK